MYKVSKQDILLLREHVGESLNTCRLALIYSQGDMEVAIAYTKAVGLAVATPGLSFDERVKSFIIGGNTNGK